MYMYMYYVYKVYTHTVYPGTNSVRDEKRHCLDVQPPAPRLFSLTQAANNKPILPFFTW